MILAPVSMLTGKGSGPALLVVAVLVAMILSQRAKTASTTSSNGVR
jgi:hypothetical protein